MYGSLEYEFLSFGYSILSYDSILSTKKGSPSTICKNNGFPPKIIASARDLIPVLYF